MAPRKLFVNFFLKNRRNNLSPALPSDFSDDCHWQDVFPSEERSCSPYSKKGTRRDLKNYRPTTSGICHTSKLTGKAIYEAASKKHCSGENLFLPSRSEFLSKSTSTLLLRPPRSRSFHIGRRGYAGFLLVISEKHPMLCSLSKVSKIVYYDIYKLQWCWSCIDMPRLIPVVMFAGRRLLRLSSGQARRGEVDR